MDKNDHFIVKDGKVIYTPLTEPYREAIEYFHDLYENQLIDKEGFTHDFNVYTARSKRRRKILVHSLDGALLLLQVHNDDFVPMAPLKGADGKQ